MAKTSMTSKDPKTKAETKAVVKPTKEFSPMVIKEIMIQKAITYDEAKSHLEKFHR